MKNIISMRFITSSKMANYKNKTKRMCFRRFKPYLGKMQLTFIFIPVMSFSGHSMIDMVSQEVNLYTVHADSKSVHQAV